MSTEQPPLTADALEQAIRDYIADDLRRPTLEEIARRLKCLPAEVRTAFGILAKQGKAKFEAGLMTPVDFGVLASPITRPHAPILAPKPPTPSARPAAPQPPTPPAAQEEAKDQMPQYPTLIADTQTVDEYRNSGLTIEQLAAKHGITADGEKARLHSARKRLAAHRRGESVYRKPIPVAASQFTCADCKDSGFQGGGDSGVPCPCAIGQRMKDSLRQRVIDEAKGTEGPAFEVFLWSHEGITKAHPASPIVAAPQATAAPDQREGTPANVEAATSLAARDGGMLMDVPQDSITMTVDPTKVVDFTKAPGYSATAVVPISSIIPTAEQLPAILTDLEGHAPTQAEREAVFGAEAQTDRPLTQSERLAEIMAQWDTWAPSVHKASYAALLARTFDMEETLKNRWAMIEQLRGDVDVLTATIERATGDDAERQQRFGLLAEAYEHGRAEGQQWASLFEQAIEQTRLPLFFVVENQALTEVLIDHEGTPKLGDEVARTVVVDDFQQVHVYRVSHVGTTQHGAPVRILTLVYSSAAKGEAA